MKKYLSLLVIVFFLLVPSFNFQSFEYDKIYHNNNPILQSRQSDIVKIVENYGNSVVLIAGINEDESVNLGSGFLVENNGIIITNYHIIEGSYPLIVKLINGDVYDDISIIDYNTKQDIAIIKIKGWNLPCVKLGNSDQMRIGEQIVVIGNPKGLENTVSNGLVSGIRDTKLGYKLHQISAPISSGSSGSPVFNLKGEVIGIATSSIVDGQNLNFSVPINYARGMLSSEIKMSLKEFSKLKLEKQTNFLEKKSNYDFKNILEEINKIIYLIYYSYDNFVFGWSETVEPHLENFYSQKFRISSSLFLAKESIINADEMIRKLNCNDTRISGLCDKYSNFISKFYEAVEMSILGLKNKPYPNWTALIENEAKIIVAISTFLWAANKDYLKIVSQEYPELNENLLPIVSMSGWNFNYPVKFGIYLAWSQKEVRVINVIIPSAAHKAGIRRNDIIQGEYQGRKFNTIKDLHYFLMRRKPGETVILEVNRSGKRYSARVKF